ncbi:bifunctional diaminohydroxyphosphoribosylaminopyrimidine deaminase/5-amino-6-(5-phosphoribosylamino)uracil reductase RibD [Oceanispirochaeta crateris]|uniref:Riboflavin biosynthesis protein RibD n=1 Tax=Oceanispirochaeta crateris TaxID=2518645 RepID=A0A5C1QPP0_9SPIO|nr:bifunctional diaminohydroxyphosphoribosylaminopyrimidine deaminase/5-amino-6-(5-phosphoribosylamino)uracil reductase RibD [Oceanispirochaeta crateris]QEN08990.1 bifunctional diaminohydroxyphosphoribosylaminopyrimidine deaminase/5-amino-6-(5-phosphoribosylamino)uracil reductase RibD [Oceanispirochaeta crateris]
MQIDEVFMREALELAKRGWDKVFPNPMVGALIVRDGEVLAKGWHERYGAIHAEAAALANCLCDPIGATLFVTLEPCCHSGKGKHNPPCTDAIIRAGISRVVIARVDPNPSVAGGGISKLRDHGISVLTGVLEEESARLNRVYETLIREERPYVHLKAAISLDGFLAASDGTSKWISSAESRDTVMHFRSQSDGILTGRGTLFTDLPSLTVRDGENKISPGRQPARIFLNSRGKIPEGWQKEGGQVHIYHNQCCLIPENIKSDVHFCPVPGDSKGLSLPHVLSDLRKKNIHRLLVEGGSKTFGSFLRNGLWDRMTLFVAPILLGEGIPFSDGLEVSTVASKLKLRDMTSSRCGNDVMFNGYREALTCLPV